MAACGSALCRALLVACFGSSLPLSTSASRTDGGRHFVFCGPSGGKESKTEDEWKSCFASGDCLPVAQRGDVHVDTWEMTPIVFTDAECDAPSMCVSYLKTLWALCEMEDHTFQVSDIEERFCETHVKDGLAMYQKPQAVCHWPADAHATPILETDETENSLTRDIIVQKWYSSKRVGLLLHARIQGLFLSRRLELTPPDHKEHRNLAERIVALTQEVVYRDKTRPVLGIFPKVAQNLAMREDRCRSPVLREKLAMTQEDNKQHPITEVKDTIEAAGGNVLVSEWKIKEPPIGVGSVGQVHLVERADLEAFVSSPRSVSLCLEPPTQIVEAFHESRCIPAKFARGLWEKNDDMATSLMSRIGFFPADYKIWPQTRAFYEAKTNFLDTSQLSCSDQEVANQLVWKFYLSGLGLKVFEKALKKKVLDDEILQYIRGKEQALGENSWTGTNAPQWKLDTLMKFCKEPGMFHTEYRDPQEQTFCEHVLRWKTQNRQKQLDLVSQLTVVCPNSASPGGQHVGEFQQNPYFQTAPKSQGVLKVTFPKLKDAYIVDWKLMDLIYEQHKFGTPGVNEKFTWAAVKPMKDGVLDEFDLSIEARNTALGASAVSKVTTHPSTGGGNSNFEQLLEMYNIRVPTVFDRLAPGLPKLNRKLTTWTMLMQQAGGISMKKFLKKVYDRGFKQKFRGQEWAEVESADLLRLLVELYGHLMLRTGVFMADPHPGNFLVDAPSQSKRTLWVLDWGNTGTLDLTERCDLAKAFQYVGRAAVPCPTGDNVIVVGESTLKGKTCVVSEDHFNGSVTVGGCGTSIIRAVDLVPAKPLEGRGVLDEAPEKRPRCGLTVDAAAQWGEMLGLKTEQGNRAYLARTTELLFDTRPLKKKMLAERFPGSDDPVDNLHGMPKPWVLVARSLGALQGAIAGWVESTQPDAWADERLRGLLKIKERQVQLEGQQLAKQWCEKEGEILKKCIREKNGLTELIIPDGPKLPEEVRRRKEQCDESEIKKEFQRELKEPLATLMKATYDFGKQLDHVNYNEKYRIRKDLEELQKVNERASNAREQLLEKSKDSHSTVRRAVQNGLWNADRKVERIKGECEEYKKQSDALEECDPGFHDRLKHFFIGQRVRARDNPRKYAKETKWKYGKVTNLQPRKVLLDENAEDGDYYSFSYDEVESAEPIIPQCREDADPAKPTDRDQPERAQRRTALRTSLDRLLSDNKRMATRQVETWGQRVRKKIEVRLNQMSAVQTWWKVAETVIEQDCQS